MRLIELTEIHDDAQHIMATISKDCKPFLNRIGSKITTYPIYRGMNSYNPESPIVKKQVRLDDRSPMSSAQVKHDMYNEYFTELYGEPFRNALFASGDKKMAGYYGNVFQVFPIGHYDWVWSTQVTDMALDIQWPSVGGFINVPPSMDTVTSTLDNLDYNMNSDFLGAIKSGNEIMIRCKEYYAVKPEVFEEINF